METVESAQTIALARCAQAGDGLNVGYRPQRIAGRLDPDQPCLPGNDGRANRVEVGHVDKSDLMAVAREVAEPLPKAPVHELRGHDVGAREGQENRRRRSHARTEHHGLASILELSDQCFGLVDGDIVRASVDEARAVVAVLVARIGGCHVNRRGHGARRRFARAQARLQSRSSPRQRRKCPFIHPGLALIELHRQVYAQAARFVTWSRECDCGRRLLRRRPDTGWLAMSMSAEHLAERGS